MDTNDTKNTKIIYPELSYKLCGLFYKVHNKLGRFCKEKTYGDALEVEIKENNISFKRENKSPINYNEKQIGYGKYDFLVENKIVIEIKARPFITKQDYYQILRYLKSENIKLGLLVNFRNKYIKPKRIAN